MLCPWCNMGGGGWISIWNQGIEAQKIWNLGTEKISGIWDLGVLDNFFWQNKFSQQLYGPKISKHKSILQMDPQTETGRPNTLAITGAWWYNHNHNAPRYARTFQGSHQISEGIFEWPQIEPHGTMWLCDPLNHYFNFWPSLTQLDLIIWFSLYLIKTRPLEQLGVCVVVPKCHNYKTLFECQFSIIIVNCFHVFVNEIPTLRAHIQWTPAFEGASDDCLFAYK